MKATHPCPAEDPAGERARGRILVAARHLDHPEARMFAALARNGWRLTAVVHPERRYADVLTAADIEVHSFSTDWRGRGFGVVRSWAR